MPRTNPERNYLVYRSWQEGRTIDEMAILTGIPRSTIGYYVRKFNRYAKMQLEPPIPATVSHSEAETYQSALTKTIGVRQILDLALNEDPQIAYYKLNVLKLAMEMINKLQLNPEEKKRLPKEIQNWATLFITRKP